MNRKLMEKRFDVQVGVNKDNGVSYLVIGYGQEDMTVPILGSVNIDDYAKQSIALVELCNQLLRADFNREVGNSEDSAS